MHFQLGKQQRHSDFSRLAAPSVAGSQWQLFPLLTEFSQQTA
jgi:hypothetical protein